MKYQSVKEMATRWNVSERSVRNYCALGKIPGAFLTGKTWNIPNDAQKPTRKNQKKNRPQTLLEILQLEKNVNYLEEFIIKFKLILLIIPITWKEVV